MLLGSSGTGAMEAAVGNLFASGERLLSCPIGVFGKRFGAIAQRYGCIVETLDTPFGHALDSRALAARLEADTARESPACCSPTTRPRRASQTTWPRSRTSCARTVHVTLVDSISGLGAGEFRMDEWGYDAVATASQKAFAAPPGVAMLALSERAGRRMAEREPRRFYFDFERAEELREDRADAVDAAALGALRARRRARALSRRRHAGGLRAPRAQRHDGARAVGGFGFTLFSSPDAHSDTVVAAYPPTGVDAARLVRRLREEHGVVLSGGQAELAGKILRFGTMGDVSEGDFARAFDAIASALESATSGVAGSTA